MTEQDLDSMLDHLMAHPESNAMGICRRTSINNQRISVILRKLEKDGYVDSKNSTAGMRYSASYDGIIFLQRGGYKAESRRIRRKDQLDQIERISLIAGGIGGSVAGIYFLRKVVLYVWNLCLMCPMCDSMHVT